MLAWVAFNWLGSDNAASYGPKIPANRLLGAVVEFVSLGLDEMLSSNTSSNALPLSGTLVGLT